jgi:hypothetical protein
MSGVAAADALLFQKNKSGIDTAQSVPHPR